MFYFYSISTFQILMLDGWGPILLATQLAPSVPGCRQHKPKLRAPDLKRAIGGHFTKKKNTLCDCRQKIQNKVDALDDSCLIKQVQ